jgi:menaquinone-specific isochorismate synthase
MSTVPLSTRPARASVATSAPAVRVRTTRIDDPGPLPELLPAGDIVSWVRDGDGIVGWGEAARIRLTGTDIAERAREWWQRRLDGMQIEDGVGTTGTGPLLFGSMPFDGRTSEATFVVPRMIVGRRAGTAWITTYDGASGLPGPVAAPPARAASATLRYADGALSASAWMSAVAEAVRRIRAGEAGKLVLARDLVVTSNQALHANAIVRELAERYPSCWTFCVDGLLGATPEMLVAKSGRRVLSRVLAGTVAREADAAGATLLNSAKDQSEHAFSARSVADSLAKYCDDLDVPPGPRLLQLPNVTHLATDISGTLRDDVSALELAGALHPTAAVCGAPTDVARDLIPELEQMNRGRYAGPVGWLDAAGDGEWGIALRCAQLGPDSVRMFAGCGIVAGSDPAAELAESQAKFLVVRDALEAASAVPR